MMRLWLTVWVSFSVSSSLDRGADSCSFSSSLDVEASISSFAGGCVVVGWLLCFSAIVDCLFSIDSTFVLRFLQLFCYG